MEVLSRQIPGSTQLVVGAIVAGVVLLFVALFMLASLEPIFAGRLTECSFTNTAPSAGAALNATGDSGSTSANITFASATNQQGYCTLVINISNTSATSGSYLEVRNAATASLISNHTVPTTYQAFTSSSTISHSTGNYLINVTAFGGNNLTVPTSGTYFRCCASLVAQQGPAGQHYNAVVVMIASIFAVIGLVLIVFGLATAMQVLKQMF